MKLKVKYVVLTLASFIVLTAPLLIVLCVKWDTYTTSYSYGGTIKLTAGGVMAVGFLIMMLLGKLKMPRGIIIAGVVFMFAWLLESILKDLKLLSGMFLLGETLYYIFFHFKCTQSQHRVRFCAQFFQSEL